MISQPSKIEAKNYYIYSSLFLAEFSFFFILPIMGASHNVNAKQISLYFMISIIIEGILLFIMTGFFHKFKKRNLILYSLLFRVIGFTVLLNFNHHISWLIFLLLISISKSLSKPTLRDILVNNNHSDKLKRKTELYALFQNIAIFIAPLLGWINIKYDIVNIMFIFFILVNMIFMILTYYIIKDTTKSNHQSTAFSVIYTDLKEIMTDKNIFIIIFISFLCFFIMGMFITITTILPKFHQALANYSGLFFSFVGVSVCVFQGILFKIIDSKLFLNIPILFLLSILSSVFLIYDLYFALIALLAYSLYESILIPAIYYYASITKKSISNTSIFSYILIMASLGEAIGSYIAGLIAKNMYTANYMFMAIIFLASISSSWIILKIKRNIQCQA